MTSISTPIEEKVKNEEGVFQTQNILTIVGGHFVHDTYSAFISPLLPLLIEKLSLSLTLGGSLSIFMQLPSLLSIVIGYLADRISVRYLVIFAPATTATLISILGLMETYWSLVILLFTAGISIMAFHAPAPAMIAHISGKQVGRGMSFFMAGGELGRTVGPLLVGWGVTEWGLDGIWRLAVFGWIATAVLYVRLRHVSGRSKRKTDSGLRAIMPQFRRLFAPLFAVMFFRNFMVTALSVYLVVFLVDKGYGLIESGQALALWSFAGVAGALVGGTASDYIGRKRTVIIAAVLSSILMAIFLNVEGATLLPLLIALGFTSLSVTPVLQALVQDHMPNNRATGSGMFILFAFLIRATNTLILGMIGDAYGLQTAFAAGIIAMIIAVPLVLLLPSVSIEQEAD